ncbi:hypothetical protein ACIF85_39975 [Streptomyces sp. NPDC086033]|uniref:hypothetical protein n=1 Tax=Streptomyces sp. NPDC086033 TaxID=3365747 RepID=UPI0037D42E25
MTRATAHGRSTRQVSLVWTAVSCGPTRFGHARFGSRISVQDMAVALIDEAELPRFVQRRFTVGY